MRKDVQATEAKRFEDQRSFVFKDGREFLFTMDWRARVMELWIRCLGKCEYINSDGVRCRNLAQDPHHIIPRSKGRDDRLGNLQALCRYHHDLIDPRKVISDKKARRNG